MNKFLTSSAKLAAGAAGAYTILYDRYPRSLNLYSYEMKNRNREEEMWISTHKDTIKPNQFLLGPLAQKVKKYVSPPFCWNPHISIIYSATKFATYYGNEDAIKYERVYLAGDDGKVALDFAYPSDGKFDCKKVVLMVPGVSGASTANYCLEAVFQLKKRGFTVCVINHIAPRGDV